jgi:hypothetical protein
VILPTLFCCQRCLLLCIVLLRLAVMWWPQAFLIDGMESLSQAKVGSALQVFFNLEQLQQVSRPRTGRNSCTQKLARGWAACRWR